MIKHSTTCRYSHFRVAFCLCFKTSPGAQPFIWKCVLLTRSLSCKSNSFPNERLCTRTRFETQANDNSEMAYFFARGSVDMWLTAINLQFKSNKEEAVLGISNLSPPPHQLFHIKHKICCIRFHTEGAALPTHLHDLPWLHIWEHSSTCYHCLTTVMFIQAKNDKWRLVRNFASPVASRLLA